MILSKLHETRRQTRRGRMLIFWPGSSAMHLQFWGAELCACVKSLLHARAIETLKCTDSFEAATAETDIHTGLGIVASKSMNSPSAASSWSACWSACCWAASRSAACCCAACCWGACWTACCRGACWGACWATCCWGACWAACCWAVSEPSSAARSHDQRVWFMICQCLTEPTL